MIFNIQRFCVNDGPGIRTTVFLKGCPLHCIWCHNPESQSPHPELLFDAEGCTLCGTCAALCPHGCHTVTATEHHLDRTCCTLCGRCLEAWCGHLEMIGKDVPVQEILAQVERDRPFYQKSGGGLTLSGGEPMYSFAFTMELLRGAKERNLHVCMETCGASSPEHFRDAAELVDIFLYDYKESDPQRHRLYTGTDNARILANLRLLDNSGASLILRCPIIPSLNDRPDHFAAIAATANSLHHILEIHLEPYHPLGVKKSLSIGRPCAYTETRFPDAETVRSWIETVSSMTNIPVRQA